MTTHNRHTVADELRKLADIIDAGPPTLRGALQIHLPDNERAGVDRLAVALDLEPARAYVGDGRSGYQTSGRYHTGVSVIVACNLYTADLEKIAGDAEQVSA